MPAASLLSRGAGLLAGLWVASWLLPVLPDLVAALLVLGLGGLIALPWAWAGAVRRGFVLGMFKAGARLRPLLGGALLRPVVLGMGGALAGALLLLRLVEAGPEQWALVGLALPVTWGLMVWLSPWARAELVGLHAHRLVHWTAGGMAVAGLVLLSAILSWLQPFSELPPFSPADAAGPLVTEALAFTRLWAGLESFALGQTTAFGTWGRGLALLIFVAGQAAVLGAACTLAIALALPWREWPRALGPASDAVPPPAVGRVGPAMAIVLASGLIATALGTSQWLDSRAPEERPSAQMMVMAERIGDAFYRPGTYGQIDALRREVLAQDAALAGELAAAIEAGFDAMEANVDPFLDSYYSMSAEYWRLAYWVARGLEGHLQRHLEEELNRGEPLAGLQTLLDTALPEIEARHAALAEQESALLAANRIEDVNPGLLRVDERFPALPAFDSRLKAGLGNAEPRWGVAAGAGLVSGAIAARVAQRLAARGVLRGAGLVLLRFAGLPVALGVDYLLLRAEEMQNREAFRAEIMAEIDALRQETSNSLNPEEGEGHLALID